MPFAILQHPPVFTNGIAAHFRQPYILILVGYAHGNINSCNFHLCWRLAAASRGERNTLKSPSPTIRPTSSRRILQRQDQDPRIRFIPTEPAFPAAPVSHRAEDCTEMDPFQDTTFSGQLNAECRRILPILSHFYAIFCRVQHFAGVLGLQPRQFAYFISVGRRGSHERFQVGVHTWPIQYRFYLHGHSGILGALMTHPPKSLYAVERHYFLHSGCESDRKGFSARADTCALACRQNGLL